MDNDKAIRSQLVKTLRGGQAFETFDEIVNQIPVDARFVVPENRGRSAWEIVEHMRVSLVDLAEFIDNADGSYKELAWPEEYWPKMDSAPNPGDWDRSIDGFRVARGRIEGLVLDEDRELTASFPWGEGQTLLHEVLLAIEHTAYHLGELVELTAVLSA